MGRKSWESLPPRFRPLPNRVNCVVSRNADFQAEGAHVFSNLQSAVETARQSNAEKVFIIGGAQIYTQSIEEDLVDEMYITHVDATFADADVSFPAIDNRKWEFQDLGRFEADENNEYAGKFFLYRKKEGPF